MKGDLQASGLPGDHMASTQAKPAWLVIVGPTAVGKSCVTEGLAGIFQTDILVADSKQIYMGLEIGTGKPASEARARVRRHLIDFVKPDAFFSAGAYKKKAEALIATLEAAGRKVLIEGGTGLYLKAILKGLWDGPPADWDMRREFAAREASEGEGTLHRLLAAVDPHSAAKMHFRDLPKIIRALEVHRLTGQTLAEWHSAHRITDAPQRRAWVIGLRREREDLYRRIDRRVDRMIDEGLVEEVAGLLEAGLSPELPSMRSLGYRQIVPYLRGACSRDEAVAILKRDSRRFAKRQLTWFRADPAVEWLDVGREENAEETVARIGDAIMRLKKSKSML